MVSMIMVSGLRAGLVIGLIVTPSKIQREQSLWNKKFGGGGGGSSSSSSMDVGSADSHTRPTSRWMSALVIPPIRNSAIRPGSADPTHSAARAAALMPTSRSLSIRFASACPEGASRG
jgi:hypothetical protein